MIIKSQSKIDELTHNLYSFKDYITKNEFNQVKMNFQKSEILREKVQAELFYSSQKIEVLEKNLGDIKHLYKNEGNFTSLFCLFYFYFVFRVIYF